MIQHFAKGVMGQGIERRKFLHFKSKISIEIMKIWLGSDVFNRLVDIFFSRITIIWRIFAFSDDFTSETHQRLHSVEGQEWDKSGKSSIIFCFKPPNRSSSLPNRLTPIYAQRRRFDWGGVFSIRYRRIKSLTHGPSWAYFGPLSHQVTDHNDSCL